MNLKKLNLPNTEHLAYLAAIVAIEAPARANRYASCARIPWPVVNQIRAALEASGYDWKHAVAHRKIIDDAKRELLRAKDRTPRGWTEAGGPTDE